MTTDIYSITYHIICHLIAMIRMIKLYNHIIQMNNIYIYVYITNYVIYNMAYHKYIYIYIYSYITYSSYLSNDIPTDPQMMRPCLAPWWADPRSRSNRRRCPATPDDADHGWTNKNVEKNMVVNRI